MYLSKQKNKFVKKIHKGKDWKLSKIKKMPENVLSATVE